MVDADLRPALAGRRVHMAYLDLPRPHTYLMPPTGGFGGATGVAEAHNLAWKLAAVLRGQTGDGLLDSYHDERHPVAQFTLRQALIRSSDRFGTGLDGELIDRATVLLGHRYSSRAVLGGGHEPVPVAELPGTRAPHVQLPGGGSTLDAYGSGFVLLTGRTRVPGATQLADCRRGSSGSAEICPTPWLGTASVRGVPCWFGQTGSWPGGRSGRSPTRRARYGQYSPRSWRYRSPRYLCGRDRRDDRPCPRRRTRPVR